MLDHSLRLCSEGRQPVADHQEMFDGKNYNFKSGSFQVGAGLVSDCGVSEGVVGQAVANKGAQGDKLNDSVITTYQYPSYKADKGTLSQNDHLP